MRTGETNRHNNNGFAIKVPRTDGAADASVKGSFPFLQHPWNCKRATAVDLVTTPLSDDKPFTTGFRVLGAECVKVTF